MINKNFLFTGLSFPPKDVVAYRDMFWKEAKRYKPGYEDNVENLRTYPEDYIEFRYNNTGFRGPNILDYPTDKKIVCVGCSMTEGEGVKYEHTWPAQLQERIKEKLNIEIPVFNLGKRSAGTATIFRILHGLVQQRGIEPDVVIVLLPEFDRHELIYDNWEGFFRVFPEFEDPKDIRKQLSHEWYKGTNDKTSFYIWLQQYFLIKYFLKSHNIFSVLSSWSPDCNDFLKVFDPDFNLCGNITNWNNMDENNEFGGIDVANDYYHPGPMGYKLFVDNLEKTLFTNKEFLSRIGYEDLGNISQQS